MNLAQLNALPANKAHEWFEQTCAASRWCKGMVNARPYKDFGEIKKQATLVWQDMQETDFLEAFAAHPMIGDLNSLKKKFANTANLASHEQSGTANANIETLRQIQQLNQQYLSQNGFIFIICASGLSAEQMLNDLKQRIKHERQTEITIAARHQLNITLLRLQNMLDHPHSGEEN